MSLREEQDVTTMTDFKKGALNGERVLSVGFGEMSDGENVTVKEKYATKLSGETVWLTAQLNN